MFADSVKQFSVQMKQKPLALTCLLIFLACCAVYLVNSRVFSSNDNIPHTLLAFNWLENQTLHFDNFTNSHFFKDCQLCFNGVPYFFQEAPNGHITSSYPIGAAIVTFPLYLLFF